MGLKQFFGYFPPVCRPVELVFMQNTFVNKGVCENMFAFANTSLQLRRKLLNAEPKVRLQKYFLFSRVLGENRSDHMSFAKSTQQIWKYARYLIVLIFIEAVVSLDTKEKLPGTGTTVSGAHCASQLTCFAVWTLIQRNTCNMWASFEFCSNFKLAAAAVLSLRFQRRKTSV